MPQVTIQVLMPRLLDVLCNAHDGNAFGYWIDRSTFDFELPPDFDLRKLDWLPADGSGNGPAYWAKVSKVYFAPLVEGGRWTFTEIGDGDVSIPRVLDREALQRGLQIMAEQHPAAFADLLCEDDDIWTADCLIQCCVLGKVVYG